MNRPELFESAWLKWGWAVRHAYALQDDITRVAAETDPGHLFTTRTEYDAQEECLVARVATLDPLPDAWRLQLGDLVACYRSCLNHLAWAVYERGSRPALSPDEERFVGFPLTRVGSEFGGEAPTRLPGAQAADVAIIRRYQPYQVGKARVDLHAFVLLNKLANQDKHVAVAPLLAIPAGGVVEVSNLRDCEFVGGLPKTRRVPLKVDAELCRVHVRKTGANPRGDVEAKVSSYVAINEVVVIQEWLTQTRSFSYQLLSELAAPPVSRLLGIGVRVGTKCGQPTVEVIG